MSSDYLLQIGVFLMVLVAEGYILMETVDIDCSLTDKLLQQYQ